MSFPARSVSPRRSMRARISPTSPRSTASGLIRMSERSTAIERPSLLRAAPPSGRTDLEGRELDGSRFDRSLAVRTDLPERLERRLAVGTGLLQLRRADRADEKVGGHLGATNRAVEVAACKTLLHRPDLELALAHVLEVLGRPEEHVDERADERRHEPEQDRRTDEPGILDSPPRVLVHPVADREPEDDDEEDREVAEDRPGARPEEVVQGPEETRIAIRCQNHSSLLSPVIGEVDPRRSLRQTRGRRSSARRRRRTRRR